MRRKHEHTNIDADRSIISSNECNVISVLCDPPHAVQQDEGGDASRKRAIREAMARSRKDHAKVLEELARS